MTADLQAEMDLMHDMDEPPQDDTSNKASFTYMDTLNDPQRAAVEKTEGAVLVLAGAGTGKTRVLTTRLGHILNKGLAYPGQILSVTFTNKAAQEMKNRVSQLLGGAPVEGWWLGTFHALSARMLRRHAELVGLTPDFTILDTDDQLRLIKQLLEANNIDAKKWPPRQMLGVIDKWKNKALRPDQLDRHAAGDLAGGRLVDLYRQYQDRLRQLNACDFGDLLLHMVSIFRDPQHAAVLQDYHRRFRYILVDEYQDTNSAQYMWLRLLAQGSRNICCVGDDDQSIYGWRGAEVENILRFEKDFPGATVIRLEQNYRSTGRILAAAGSVISHNEGRLGKTLWSAGEEGEQLRLIGVWDGEAEARRIGEEIENLQRGVKEGRGMALNEMAVLVRASFQMRAFEERFMTLGVPYRVVGGPRFYERAEIRDAMAYLRIIAQPADDLALERIINVPKRGIGAASVKKIHDYARQNEIPIYEACLRMTETDILPGKARNAIKQLTTDFERWRGISRDDDAIPHTELAQIVLDESGYTDMWQQDKSPDAPGRLENLKELVSAMGEFENLGGFLEHVSLVMENQESSGEDKVTIMTLHAAKGLEFDAVFLPGWEEGLFPSQRTLDENGQAGLEEERRLAYVGITRARKRAYISHAAQRRMYGQWVSGIPSRFIDELPEEHIERENESGTYGGRQSAGYGGSYGGGSYGSSGYGGGYGGDNSFKSPSKRHRPPVIDATSSDHKVRKRTSSGEYGHGDRIFHQKFGYGTVMHAEHDKLNINFDKAGRKKLMAAFVVPADQAE